MVKFSIKEITIQDFRGIHELSLPLTQDHPTVLIGPNNAGKSSLLDAVGLVMCSPKFLSFQPENDDFWIDSTGTRANQFKIAAIFQASEGDQLPAVKPGVGDPIDVSGILCIGDLESLSFDRYLLSPDGNQILLTKSTPVSKAQKDKYKGMGLGGRAYAKTYDIQKWLPDVWQLDPKNLFVSLYQWKTGPLQRLLALYKEKLFTEEWDIDKTHKMPAVLEDVYSFLKKALKTPFWETELTPKLNAKLRAYLGKEVGGSITPELNNIDAWILSQFIVRVSPASGLWPVDVRRLGDGWQSLLRLAALEVLMELKETGRSILLLMEEPETYLHPHLRRKMRRLFSALQADGNQVLCATHSQELISFSENFQIVRLSMTTEGTRYQQYLTASTDQAIKDQEKVGERGNHEMVFANRTILTEGKPDQFAVLLGLEKQGIDPDTEGVSVIDCGGVNNIPGYAKICSSLGIPWFAIHDCDKETNGKRKPKTQQAREQMEKTLKTSDSIEAWENDLEDVIGFRSENPTGSASPSWIAQKWGPTDWKGIMKALPAYASIMTDLSKWLRANNKPTQS